MNDGEIRHVFHSIYGRLLPVLMKLHNKLLSLFVAILVVASVARPVLAFTSLQGCVTDPVCAAELGLQAGASAATGSTAAQGLVAGAGVGVATGVGFYLWPWGETQADDYNATGGFPSPFDASPYGGVQMQIYSPNNATTLTRNLLSWEFMTIAPGVIGWDTVTCAGSPGGGEAVDPSSVVILTTGACFANPNPGSFPTVTGDPGAIEGISGTPTPVYFPITDPTPSDATNGDSYYGPVTVPASPTNPLIWVNPTTGEPETITSPQTIPAPDIGPEGNPNPAPAPETTENSDPNLSGEYTPEDLLEPAQFNKPHFLSHAATVFADKFPLDVLGTLPEAETESCPTLTFWGTSYEVCIINDLLQALKIPTLVSFTIWALLTL